MTFLQKSYSEYSKFEKPVLVGTSYEGWDDDNNNVVTDSDIECDDEQAEENLFDYDIDEDVKQPPRPPSMLKWFVQ